MTATTRPNCRTCGLVMRRADLTDGWECRCGTDLDEHGHWRPGARMPFVESEPGIRVTMDFASLARLAFDTRHVVCVGEGAIDILNTALEGELRNSGVKLGKRAGTGVGAQRLRLYDGRELQMLKLYAVCFICEVVACARRMASELATSGTVYPGVGTSILHFMGESNRRARGMQIGGVEHVLLAAYYFRDDGPIEKTCPADTQRCQSCAKPIADVDRYKAVDIVAGQVVEWVGCEGCFRSNRKPQAEPDMLDVEYDGRTLRELLMMDERNRHERLEFRDPDPSKRHPVVRRLTPAQRAAVEAHWSAELRAKRKAQSERERNVVTYCEVDADD